MRGKGVDINELRRANKVGLILAHSFAIVLVDWPAGFDDSDGVWHQMQANHFQWVASTVRKCCRSNQIRICTLQVNWIATTTTTTTNIIDNNDTVVVVVRVVSQFSNDFIVFDCNEVIGGDTERKDNKKCQPRQCCCCCCERDDPSIYLSILIGIITNRSLQGATRTLKAPATNWWRPRWHAACSRGIWKQHEPNWRKHVYYNDNH